MEYSEENFDALLKWLDPDRDRAAEKYEAIRRRLSQYFALRQCANPEELTDETMRRVARRAAEITANYQGEPGPYFYAFARKVLHESFQKPTLAELTEDLPVSYVDKEDRLDDCLGKCLRRIKADERELLLTYYFEDEKRAKLEAHRRLAAQLAVTPSTLRISIAKIRTMLRECVNKCMKSQQREHSDNI